VDVAHPLEAQRGQRALDRLALGIEDAGLGPDEDLRPQLAAPTRSSQAENGSPASSSYAWT